MATWTFDPSQYKEKNFEIIPAGDYRARITEVTERKFNSGNEGYEITLEINGYNAKMWYYLVLDKSNPERTNQRLGEFFDSFGIGNYSLGSGKQWVGKVGAVRIKHEEYKGNNRATVAYTIARNRQDKLTPWKGSATAAVSEQGQVEIPDMLPFDMS